VHRGRSSAYLFLRSAVRAVYFALARAALAAASKRSAGGGREGGKARKMVGSACRTFLGDGSGIGTDAGILLSLDGENGVIPSFSTTLQTTYP
jgi:hypothetical protein